MSEPVFGLTGPAVRELTEMRAEFRQRLPGVGRRTRRVFPLARPCCCDDVASTDVMTEWAPLTTILWPAKLTFSKPIADWPAALYWCGLQSFPSNSASNTNGLCWISRSFETTFSGDTIDAHMIFMFFYSGTVQTAYLVVYSDSVATGGSTKSPLSIVTYRLSDLLAIGATSLDPIASHEFRLLARPVDQDWTGDIPKTLCLNCKSYDSDDLPMTALFSTAPATLNLTQIIGGVTNNYTMTLLDMHGTGTIDGYSYTATGGFIKGAVRPVFDTDGSLVLDRVQLECGYSGVAGTNFFFERDFARPLDITVAIPGTSDSFRYYE